MKKKSWAYLGAALGLGLLVYIIWLAASNSQDCATMPATEMDIGDHQNIISHIHSTLSITINGEKLIIPSNIGVPTGVMRPIHTHDSSGKIHIEGLCPRDFTLGEFFDIWGQTLTDECIMSYCEDETHTLTMFVNGIETTRYRDLILKDNDEIEIVYEETT